MNRKISSILLFAAVMLAAGVILLNACSSPAPAESPPTQAPTSPPIPTNTPTPAVSPVDLTKAFEDAFNRGDVPAIMALVTEDVSWSFPSAGINDTGRQDVQMVYEFTSGLNTKMQLTGCQSSGDMVTCKLTFGDECVRSSGVDAFPGEAVFTINQDKIRRTLIDIPSDVLTSYWAWSDKYSAWFEKTYPSQWAQIGAGQFPFDHETGTILAGRCKEYAETLKTSPVNVVKAYEDAYNRHDVPGVMALLAEDVSWLIPSWGDAKLSTRLEVQNGHEFYSGMNVETHFTDCHVSGNTVTCKQSFADDCIRSAGIGVTPGVTVFTINQDKIQVIKWDATSDELTNFSSFWDKFGSWWDKTYPSESAAAYDSWLTRETGSIVGKRCKEYAVTLE